MVHALQSKKEKRREKRRKNKRARTGSLSQGQRVAVLTLSAGSVVGIIKMYVGLVVGYVLDVERQAIESGNAPRLVSIVSTVVPKFQPVARLSRVPLLVPPVVNIITEIMHSSPDMIKKVLLIQLWVCHRPFILLCVF